MKPFCEVIVSTILPAIRSLITRELLKTYGLTQKQVAELLGLTQPAISQYNREYRGFNIQLLEKDPEIIEMIDVLTEKIYDGKLTPVQILSSFCNICKKVRESRIICSLHEQIYPQIAPCLKCPHEC